MTHGSSLLTILLLALVGCANESSNGATLNKIYEQATADAAIKRPDFVKQLQPIDGSADEITVAHLQPYPTIDTGRYIWVTHPNELRGFCHGRPDPLLAMQQALGLPPEKRDDFRVFTFDVRGSDIFRPCASSQDIVSSTCSLDVPDQPSGAQEHFVVQQMMKSYRAGLNGFPFTAMGWSYDWNPDSSNHQGVSEYVVKPGAMISKIVSFSPATFCSAQ